MRRISEFVKRERHLPHWEAPGESYFVTFTLKERDTCDLTRDDLAPVILDALAHFDGQRYILYDHTVMPNHAHAIVMPTVVDGSAEALDSFLGDIKGFIAYKINRILGRRGSLWLDESYDHLIRSPEQYEVLARYIFENPVTAGFVQHGHEWKWWRPGQSGRLI